MQDFVASFRETHHYLLNSVAIWTSQAEMASRHPEFYEKLAKSVLERADKLTELVRRTEVKLAALAPSGPADPSPPAP
ncbi:MAG TPA: hypothetical protein VGD78_08470 [Chthoniobacterales bacterium]